MDVPSLCVSLMVHMLFLLSTHDQKFVSCSVFLRIEPNKLQFFEYDSVLFHCEDFSGSTGLKTFYNSKGKILSCDTTSTFKSTVTSCNVSNLYPEDSGEVWCESAKTEKSNSFNITVTAGSVILESPALPVKEGEAVTLHCRNKMTPSNSSAEFYKNGLLIGSRSTGQMIIPRVSQCDRGGYKCKLSGGGESAESWLAVEGETHPCSTPWIVTSALLALLLVVGLLHLGKGYWHRVIIFLSTLKLGPPTDRTASSCVCVPISVEADRAREDKEMYAVVSKKRKKKENHDDTSGALYYTLDDFADTHQPVHSPGPSQPLTQDSFYSTIQEVAE
ncbi:low affinity immunoglobulin gamma Fc region receptor III-like [Halichoeres trimaculatus]|uniref:low affinity immunoglobulin gamma Fc region receptor III-like n=1 Tax=Halichoeres trimaculatus TaxID=147232 RepID=UPI003D9ED0F1